ncbi:hypothetical protein ABW20_dc0106525 [Dactylellina cionopaga]|nr:hypothetical protein ABW20_dc0106525 [Dactylellina cionopaga]
MSLTVLHGRVVKRGRSTKVKLSGSPLTKYKKELQYYYLSRGYTRQQVHEVMEIIFKIGATQYKRYLSKAEFSKYLREEEWQALASEYFACKALNKQMVVVLNEYKVIEPDKVKRNIERYVSPQSQSLKLRQAIVQKDIQSSDSRVKAYVSTNTDKVICRDIPKSIYSNLPCGRTLQIWIDGCHNAAQKGGREFREVFGDDHIPYLYRFLYMLSNSLFDSSEIDKVLDEMNGDAENHKDAVIAPKEELRPALKTLLAMKEVAVEHLVENILPLLILRQDEDLISHITQIHGLPQMNWYTGLVEIELNINLGYFFVTPSDAAYLSKRYHYNRDTIKRYLTKGIEDNLPIALTGREAAVLVDCALRGKLVEFSTMLMLIPTPVWADIEREYEALYSKSILESSCDLNLQELLDRGFQRNLHILAMEAVLKNDFANAAILLPYSKTKLSYEEYQELLEYGSNPEASSSGFICDIIGKDRFGQLILEVEKEASDPDCKRGQFQIQSLLPMAFALRSTRLREFLVEFFRTHCEIYHWSIESIMSDGIFQLIRRNDKASCFRIPMPTADGKTNYDDDDVTEWCYRFIGMGCNLNKYRDSGLPLERLLQSAIWMNKPRQVGLYIMLGADIDALNSLGEPPLVTAVLKQKHSGPTRVSSEISAEIDIFNQLLRAGANTTCLDLFRTRFDDQILRLSPNFINALHTRDLNSIGSLWRYRYQQIDESDDESGDESGDESDDESSKPYKIESLAIDRIEYCIENTLERTAGGGKSSWIEQRKSNGEGGFQDNNNRKELDEEREDPACLYNLLMNFLVTRTGGDYIKRQICIENIEKLLKKSRGIDYEGGMVEAIVSSEHGSKLPIPVTILQLLAVFGDPHLLQCFFQYCPREANIQISKEYTGSPSPLQFAVLRQELGCVKILIEHGADPREGLCERVWQMGSIMSDPYFLGGRRTALHLAVERGCLDIAQILVEHGADIHARRLAVPVIADEPLTVLETAVKLGRLDFVGLFLSVDIGSRGIALEAARRYRRSRMESWIKVEWRGEQRTVEREPRRKSVTTKASHHKGLNRSANLPLILPKS